MAVTSLLPDTHDDRHSGGDRRYIRSVTPATLEQARAAKRKLSARLQNIAEVHGIGIAVLDGGYGVKVNFAVRPDAGIVPGDVDGVPVVVDVVGSIRLL